MQRISSALAGAAVSLALVASGAPAQATSLQPAPAVMTSDEPAAGIQTVHDRKWRHGHRRHRDDFRFGFAFGPPIVAYPRYAYRACPYGYAFDGYGCVRTYHAYPYHYGVRPGFSIELGF
jgi:hypothetical protein